MAKPKKPEGQRLLDETPGHLRFSESEDKSSSAFDRTHDSETEDKDDGDTPPAPSISTPAPNPSSSSSSSSQPLPSTSAFLPSLSDKGKAPALPTGKDLDIDAEELKKMHYVAELLRITMSSSDNDKFSVSNPDKFDGAKPEKLETFEAQCRSVFLANERKYADPARQALFAGSYLEGPAFTGDKDPYTHWVHAEYIESTVNK